MRNELMILIFGTLTLLCPPHTGIWHYLEIVIACFMAIALLSLVIRIYDKDAS